MAEQVAQGRIAAVAAGHQAEVEAALVTLEAGGNAIDAMVAGAFCACVVEPNNAGLAGYGHLSVWIPEQREFFTVDHGPRAPAAASDDMFAVTGGVLRARDAWPHVEGRESELGGLAAAVPGAVAGLCAAHRRGGRLPLAVVLEPAIAAADAGVAVDWHLGLTILQRLHDIRQQPSAAAVLLQNGDPPTGHDDWGRGSRLDMSALAGTLRAIAREGEAAFSDPERAQYVERAVADAGGILTAADIAAYAPRIVAETPTHYRGWNLTTAEDDLGHELFGVLANFPLGSLDPGSAAEFHLMAEAFGHVFVDALAWSGDPAVTPEISAALRDPAPEGVAPHWRFKLDHDAMITWDDGVRGAQSFDPKTMSDPIVRRADGSWLYLLPSVIDDIDMGITDVVRGEDHVSNTATQLQMFSALDAAPPRFAHEALLTGSEGKLSKRLGALGCDELREAGIEPMALLALLARLGTSDPVEPVTDMQPLVDTIDFHRFGRAPARFDMAELEGLNAKVIHHLAFDAVVDRLPAGMDAAAWEAVRPNLKTVADAVDWWHVIEGPVEQRNDPEDVDFLAEAARLAADLNWTSDPWHALTGALKTSTGRTGKALFMPLRRALTGRDHGPDMAALLPLIGKVRTAERLSPDK